MEDGKQPFAAFVLEALARREVELGLEWVEHTRHVGPRARNTGKPRNDGGRPAVGPEELVRAVLAIVRGGRQSADDGAAETGHALGAAAHWQRVPLHRMLEELDCLETVLLRAAERAAGEYVGAEDGLVPGRELLVLAECICGGVSSLRLGAAKGYTRAIEDELRERYRTLRHDLRNPLGTIKSAIMLLTDETLPTEMRQSSRVRAIVARTARSLDQMIGEALGDDAASLPALGSTDGSARKERDDFRRARQRPDLESGAL